MLKTTLNEPRNDSKETEIGEMTPSTQAKLALFDSLMGIAKDVDYAAASEERRANL